MENSISRFNQFAKANPAVISAALQKEFGVVSLSRVANLNGFDMGFGEIEAFLNDNAAEAKIRVMFKDETGQLRELTEEEAQGVGGGFTLAAIAVTVVAYVVAVTVAVASTAAAVHTSAWAHTHTWTYAVP